jgi:ribosomal protein L15E
VLGFNLVVLGVYWVQETTKEKFVANVVQVEMQHCHLYTTLHVTRAANAITTY